MFAYLELLRRISASETMPTAMMQYVMFGSYDIMHYDFSEINNIQDMKRKFEKRQLGIPWQYDRQPLFLYTNSSKDNVEHIFSREGEYSHKPLVITQMHLDKEKLAQRANLDGIIDSIDCYLRKAANELKADSLEFIILMSLGEADIVIIFRDNIVKNIVNILYHTRMKDSLSLNVDVLSLCSHLAFPMNDDEKALAENIRIWIDKERESNSNLALSTLYDTNIGQKGIGMNPNASFQLGEWDFLSEVKKSQYNQFEKTILELINNSKNGKSKGYSISYTTITTQVGDLKEAPKRRRAFERSSCSHVQTADAICDQLHEIQSLIKSNPQIVDNRDKELVEALDTFSASITGLVKYATRLCSGHHQYDIHTYIDRIFSLLPDVINSYSKYIRSEIKRGNYNQVRALINDLFVYNAELVTAFQHFFAVISIAPHTFIETFGCNMRSLAASSKLLCAYQSIIHAVSDTFPDKLLIGSELVQAKHAILILPYRKGPSIHQLLYTLSSPLNRISIISLDYSKMFSIRATVFMLIHECGHHIGERLRERRFYYISKAVFGALLNRYFKGFLVNPLDAIVEFSCVVGKDGKINGKNPLELGLSVSKYNEVESEYGERIREATQRRLEKYTEILTSNFYDWYMASLKRMGEDGINGVSRQNYFASDLVSILNESISMQLCFENESGGFEDQIKEARSEADKFFSEFYNDISQIVDSMASKVNQMGGNSRTCARLISDYRMLKQRGVMPKLFEAAMRSGYLVNGETEIIASVFRDVYADLFAISILKCELEEYLRTIPELSCAQFNQIITDTALMLRIRVVCTVAYNNCSVERIIKILNVTHETSEILRIHWNEFEYYPPYIDLICYAQECYTQLICDISNACNKLVIKCLREFYSEKISEMEFIFRLWKELLRGATDGDNSK